LGTNEPWHVRRQRSCFNCNRAFYTQEVREDYLQELGRYAIAIVQFRQLLISDLPTVEVSWLGTDGPTKKQGRLS
jgi:hypothetical protein